MGFVDYLLIGGILLIVGLAAFYIIRQKKKGNQCIGCPYSSSCKKCRCEKQD